MAIRAAFFDMGETLCHQVPPTPQIIGQLLAERNIGAEATALRYGYLSAMTYYSTWAISLDVAERTTERRDVMVEEFYRIMLISGGLGDRLDLIPELREQVGKRGERPFGVLFPDVLPALAALRDRGVKLGIISNWDHTLIDVVRNLGLMPLLDVVVGSQTLGIEKPNPRVFEYALGRVGVEPWEAFHVGDVYYMDVLGARAAGITPVLVDRHSLQRGVDCLRVESLLELPEMIRGGVL